jgi:hypothetical protein
MKLKNEKDVKTPSVKEIEINTHANQHNQLGFPLYERQTSILQNFERFRKP